MTLSAHMRRAFDELGEQGAAARAAGDEAGEKAVIARMLALYVECGAPRSTRRAIRLRRSFSALHSRHHRWFGLLRGRWWHLAQS